MQLLPGIKSAGEGNSGFHVRGGGADQNLILLDEAPVYNASHLLGFFSTFNYFSVICRSVLSISSSFNKLIFNNIDGNLPFLFLVFLDFTPLSELFLYRLPN